MTNGSKTLVIGAQSMVGSRFCELSKLSLIKSDLNTNPSIDITNVESIEAIINNQSIKNIILFSAFTDVDEAEKERDDKNGKCWQINVEGVKNITELANKNNLKLIFISTDFVFDGTNGPYNEIDPYGPDLEKVSWYGQTKMAAEKIVQSTLKEYIILRISYPYRAKFPLKDDFARVILKKAKNNTLFPLFSDQRLTPTFIDDISAIDVLINKSQTGTFHLASPKITTPFEFAQKLLKTFNLPTIDLKKASIHEFLKTNNATPRPINGGLIVEKIISIGFSPTSFDDGIKRIFEQANKN